MCRLFFHDQSIATPASTLPASVRMRRRFDVGVAMGVFHRLVLVVFGVVGDDDKHTQRDDQGDEQDGKTTESPLRWWVVPGLVVVALAGAGVAVYVLDREPGGELAEAVYTIAALVAGAAGLTLADIGRDAFRRWRTERRRFPGGGGSEPGKRGST
jgi:hypothetical protein